jgi:hypothetical protein
MDEIGNSTNTSSRIPMATLSMVYEQDMPPMVRHESSVMALLQLYQGWRTWGDDRTTGPAILRRVRDVAAGNPAAIAQLKQVAMGSNPQICDIARSCLQQLALNGDTQAQDAWRDVQDRRY